MRSLRIAIVLICVVAIVVVLFYQPREKAASPGGSPPISGPGGRPLPPPPHSDVAVDPEAQYFYDHKERWPVKTGADYDASQVGDAAVPARVADLIQIAPPDAVNSADARNHRLCDPERTIYAVDADIIRWKYEKDDHDYHIVIRDHGDADADEPTTGPEGHRRTMVVESPDPAVVLQQSPWRDRIADAHATATDRLNPGNRFTRRVVHARITGVGFFDFDHGQSGRAPNLMELHPILKIEWMDD